MNDWPAQQTEMRPVSSVTQLISRDSYDSSIVHATKEYIIKHGFVQPIIINSDNIVVAGHGSYFAALELCIDSIPTRLYSSLPKSLLRNGIKHTICRDCGVESYSRRDTSPVSCKKCNGSRWGKSVAEKRVVEYDYCKVCGEGFRSSLGYSYCSVECRIVDSHTKRTCKYCNNEFSVRKSAISGKTNASGNFCSRVCYEKWLCNTERTKHYGASWKSRRKQILLDSPFCAICGTTKELQVHHIVPYRLNNNNSKENLIPLCVKHHKYVESITHDIELVETDYNQMLLALNIMLRERQQTTRAVLKNLLLQITS